MSIKGCLLVSQVKVKGQSNVDVFLMSHINSSGL